MGQPHKYEAFRRLNGSGGGGFPPDFPILVPGTERWFDGQDPLNNNGVLPPDGGLTTWFDKSGNNANAIVAPATQAPIFSQNGGDGLPTVTFIPGNSQGLVSAPVVLPAVYTYYLVVRINPANVAISKAVFNGDDDPGNAGSGIGYGVDGGNVRTIYPGNPPPELLTDGDSSANYEIITTQWDGTNNLLFFNNGSQVVSNSTRPYSPPMAGLFAIGYSRQGATSIDFWNGEIREVIVRSTADDNATRTDFNNFLARKWGVTLDAPNAIPGLNSWLDSDDPSTLALNGNNVVSWLDKSNQGNNFDQATIAEQPTFDATAINGRPGVLFDGLNDSMVNLNPSPVNSIAHTIVAVLNPLGGNTAMDAERFLALASGANEQAFGLNPTTFFLEHEDNVDTTTIADNRAYSNFHFVFAWRTNPDLNQMTTFVNNVEISTLPDTPLNSFFRIIGAKETPAGNYFNGYLQEVLVYDAALSFSQISSLTTYLLEKWNFQPTLLLEDGGRFLLEDGTGGAGLLLE